MQLINNSCAVEREAMRRIRGKIDREKKLWRHKKRVRDGRRRV
jgi:hypothetical protein